MTHTLDRRSLIGAAGALAAAAGFQEPALAASRGAAAGPVLGPVVDSANGKAATAQAGSTCSAACATAGYPP